MKRLFSGFFALVVLAGSLAMIAEAQSPPATANHAFPPSGYKLIAVTVKGSKRFTQQEIAAASGLPVGTIAHQEDFQKAARQLGDSGAFSNIAFTYSYSADGTKLEVQVTDADKFVPVHFSDFVWFSDEELLRTIHERIPLFEGELPTSGRMMDQVSDVLQAMLVERAVPGQVEYARREDKDGKLQSIDYNVAGVSIRIHHAEFPGAGAGELPLLQAAAERLTGREYSREYMSNFTQHTLLPVFYERGFLKAACGTAQPKVVKPTASDWSGNGQPPTFVDVTFPVAPGIAYKLSGWQWTGNNVIATDELQPFIHAKVGEVANTLQLQEELKKVQDLYGSRGYIVAAMKVDAEFDNAAGTVAYLLKVNEGALFRMGELEFRGLDNNLTARLRAAWKLHPGDVYDAGYLQQFLPVAKKLLPASLDWDVAPHVTALAGDKTVDVDLQYTAKAPVK
jgi:outer membrane protein assembly factor BamA